MITKSIWFLILCSLLIYPQERILTGNVIDSITGAAVSSSVIFISGNYYYSNADGTYRITSLQPGIYSIRISHISYQTLIRSIVIGEDSLQTKDFYLVPGLINLDEVIVTTRRKENYLRYSSDSELLFSKEQIQAKPFQSLSDALQTQTGISLLRDGMWGTDINIRGLSRQNIVTLIDGSRIETSTDISARLSMINSEDVERVEIIKGASSSIYGSGATGGIINIISKHPEFRETFYFNGKLLSGFNSANNLSSSSAAFFSGSKSWNTKITASFRKAGNVQTPSGKLRNSGFEDYSAAGSINFIPAGNHLLKLNYQLFKAEAGIPGGYPLFPDIADVRYTDVKRELISAGYEIKNINDIVKKVSLNFSHQYILREVESIPHSIQIVPAVNNQPAKRISMLKITPGAEHNFNSFQLQSDLLISKNNYLIAGLDFWIRSYNGEREKYQHIELLDTAGNVFSAIQKTIGEKPLPTSSFRSIGLFVQDELELIQKKLFISLGGRADGITVKGEKTYNPEYEITNGVINYTPSSQALIWNETESNEISYSSDFGITCSAFNNLDFSLSLGYSFRSPSLEERFQFIDLGNLVRLGNPGLKPEHGRFADIGIRFYSGNIKIISSFFYNHLTDLVTEVPAIYEDRQARIKTNVGKAGLYGFDISIDYAISNNLFIYSSVSFVKGEDLQTNEFLPGIPPMNSYTGIRYMILNSIEAEMSSLIFAIQDHPAPAELKTPGYATFNFSLGKLTLPVESLKFIFYSGVENIFDKNYRNHLSTSRGSITVEPGRNIYIKISAEW